MSPPHLNAAPPGGDQSCVVSHSFSDTFPLCAVIFIESSEPLATLVFCVSFHVFGSRRLPDFLPGSPLSISPVRYFDLFAKTTVSSLRDLNVSEPSFATFRATLYSVGHPIFPPFAMTVSSSNLFFRQGTFLHFLVAWCPFLVFAAPQREKQLSLFCESYTMTVSPRVHFRRF